MKSIVQQHRERWRYCRKAFQYGPLKMAAKADLEMVRAEERVAKRMKPIHKYIQYPQGSWGWAWFGTEGI